MMTNAVAIDQHQFGARAEPAGFERLLFSSVSGRSTVHARAIMLAVATVIAMSLSRAAVGQRPAPVVTRDLSDAESQRVAAAILILQNSGDVPDREIEHLQWMLQRNHIHQGHDPNTGTNGWSRRATGAFATGEDGHIYLDNALALGQDPCILAGTIHHEMRHCYGNIGIPHLDAEPRRHCIVYKDEYDFYSAYQAQLPAGHAGIAATTARKNGIAEWYPIFPTTPGPFPPAPTPIQWEALPNDCQCVVGTLPARAPWRSHTTGPIGTSDGGKVRTQWLSTNPHAVNVVSLDTQGEIVHDLVRFDEIGGTYFLAMVTADNAGGNGAVRIARDTDGDLAPDAIVDVFGTGTLDTPSSIAYIRNGGGGVDWFVLEATSKAIWRLSDADSNGVPDGLHGIVASPSSVADLSDVVALRQAGIFDSSDQLVGQTTLICCSNGRSDDTIDEGEWFVELGDTNGDGLWEPLSGRRELWTEIAIAPSTRSGAFVGDTSMAVAGNANHVVRIKEWDDNTKSFSTIIGSATLDSQGLSQVTLDSALAPDRPIKIRDVTTGVSSVPLTPTYASAIIQAVLPVGVSASVPVLVSIRGRHFAPGSTVTFSPLAGAELPKVATVVSIDESEIVVQIEFAETAVWFPEVKSEGGGKATNEGVVLGSNAEN